MPELPDVELYLQALRPRVENRALERVRLGNPFVVRTIEPPVSALEGATVASVRRLGKRIVFEFGGELFLVVHLMIAGRLRWRERDAAIPNKVGLAAFDFPDGTLILTEAGARRQASLHIVRGRAALQDHDRGGLEVLSAVLPVFASRLRRENHTLKRALTDREIETLYHATRDTLLAWIDRLQAEAAGRFPDKVTAFHKSMAVHGKYGKPCPVCWSPVQRIVYARNEANYCSRCQTGGRLLSDRALSRLLREDWPKTLDELENRRRGQAG